MRRLWLAGAGLVVLAGGAHAADLSAALPTKAPTPMVAPAYDWTGYYIGAHFGYAAGTANWSSTSGVSGALDLFNSFDAFKGTGSYFLGLQAGYDRMLASRWLMGVETDISFPSFSARGVGDSAIFSTAATGLASYAEQAEFFGTLRGRIGYAPATGCSMRPAVLPGATTNLPARSSPGCRPVAPRRPERWRTCSWCRASVASSAPGSKSR